MRAASKPPTHLFLGTAAAVAAAAAAALAGITTATAAANWLGAGHDVCCQRLVLLQKVSPRIGAAASVAAFAGAAASRPTLPCQARLLLQPQGAGDTLLH
jgi:hypothetical protein